MRHRVRWRDSAFKNIFAACRKLPAINRWARKLHRINPILRCESPIDRALFRSPICRCFLPNRAMFLLLKLL
jgi:hypothetical protein